MALSGNRQAARIKFQELQRQRDRLDEHYSAVERQAAQAATPLERLRALYSGLRAATSTGMATTVITGDGAPDIPAAVAVRPDYAGSEPMRIADCRRLHGRWCAAHKPADAA
jgi:hypothetical protein